MTEQATIERAEVVNWRDLPPVPVERRPHIRPEFRPSQTFLKLHDRCDRAAMLYLTYRAGSGGHAMNRGSIFHDVVADLSRLMIRRDESKLDSPEIAKEYLAEYMAEHPELQVEARERDDLRGMVTNWALGEIIVPERVIAVENTFTLEIGGFTIVGRIDRADDLGGGTMEVIDYKTSFAMPSDEDFAAQSFRDDGTPRWAGNFQTMIYALALAFGVFEGGFVVGQDFDRFKLSLRFPRYLRPEGLGQRSITVTREQLLDFKLDVEGQLQRLRDVNIGEGRWQPTPGAHCSECPAQGACPLPMVLREESQLSGAEPADLQRLAANAVFMEKRLRDLKGRIKKRALQFGDPEHPDYNPAVLDLGNGDRGIRAGRDLAFLFIPYESETIKDKRAMIDAMDRHVKYGEPFDYADHVRPSEGTKFEKRKVAPAALLDEGSSE